ncbi:MAG: hypothetical protein ACRDTT_28390, partial [Pseudonocardiaceae bacterium]
LSTQIERLGSADELSYLYWVNPAEMTGEVGNSLRQLGQADRAVAVLNEAITLFDDSLPRDSLSYRIHLAKALTMPGKQRDLDAGGPRHAGAPARRDPGLAPQHRPDPQPLPADDTPH